MDLNHLICVNTPFLITIIVGISIGAIVYGILHRLERRQAHIEDVLLAKTIARKLYESLKEEKKI